MSDRDDGLGLSIPGMVVAATLLGVVFFKSVPLETTRPAPEAQLPDASVTAERAPARLWEDPFNAVYRHMPNTTDRPEAPDTGGDPPANPDFCSTDTVGARAERVDPHEASAPPCIADQIAHRNQLGRKPRILAVMLPGATSVESGENRIRRRYAVLSALHIAGFVPDDATHIGWFRTIPGSDLPAVIPYEWMTATDGAADPGSVLVLWLDDTPFRQRLHRGLTGLVAGILPKDQLPADGKVDVAVLGPSSSDGLVGLLREAAAIAAPTVASGAQMPAYDAGMAGMIGLAGTGTIGATPVWPDRAFEIRLDVYSATATAADDELFDRAGIEGDGRTVADYLFCRLNLDLHRTIADDRVLVEILAAELGARFDRSSGPLLGLAIGLRKATSAVREATVDRLRGTIPPVGSGKGGKHVVLVSEWDTAYGRSLPISLCKALEAELGKTTPCAHVDQRGAGYPAGESESQGGADLPWVHRFTYMRGLDGTLGATGGHAGDHSLADALAESAQGTPQLDYLRRLAGRLVSLERGLPSGHSIAAVGILGSDIHDKLLILQALRPAFQGAVFFTTDLDARLYEPAQLQWTRGLVVATGFGLQLEGATGAAPTGIDCQDSIPPFRSGYQTAFFYAAREALGALPEACRLGTEPGYRQVEAAGQAPAPARLFEIGRTGPVALIPPRPAGDDQGADPASSAPGARALGKQDTGQARLNAWLDVLLLLVMGWGLFLVFYHRHVPLWWGALGQRLRRSPLGTSLGLILALLALGGLLAWLWRDLEVLACPLALDATACAEPFSVTSGISIWAPVYLQLLAVVLSALFIARVLVRFRANMLGLSSRYFLGRGCGIERRPAPAGLWAASHAELRHWAQVGLRWLRRPGWDRADSLADQVSARADTAADTGHPSEPLDTDDALRLWLQYCRRSRFWWRVLRVVALSILLFAVVVALYWATGGGGNSPVRDAELARIFLELRLLGVLLGGMLALAVLDIALECRRFIDQLSRASVAEEPARWPSQVAAGFQANLHLDPARLSPWIALSVISEHADLVMRLVVYPLIVLVVLVVARLPWLDTTSLPPSILIVYLVFAFYIFFVAVGIQRAANGAKARTREHYQTLLDGNRNAPVEDPKTNTQLECLIRQVSELHDGAFKPLPARPLVRMALLPFGALGVGLLELFG